MARAASTGVLLAVGSVSYEAALLAGLETPDLHVVRRCVDIADVVATAASGQASVAVVSAALRGLDVTTVARLRESSVAVVGVTEQAASADEAFLRGLGVSIVVSADEPAAVIEAVSRGDVELSGAADIDDAGARWADGVQRQGRGRGRLIAVWGPTGAPGRSSLGLGLAAEIAELGPRTLLIDADVYGGTIAQQLGMLDESSGLLAAARAANTGQLGASGLARHSRLLTPGLRVLTGLPRADRWTEVRPAPLRQVLGAARELADVTVVDCGFSLELDEEISYDTAAPRRNGATLAVLEAADLVVVVGAADPVGLSRLVRAVDDLRMAVPRASTHVLVNRMRGTLGWSTDDITAALQRHAGTTAVGFVPLDQAAFDNALVQGRTLREAAPRSKASAALARIAADLVGAPASARRVSRRTAGRGR